MLMMVYYPFRLEACIELFGGRRYVPLAAQRQFVLQENTTTSLNNSKGLGLFGSLLHEEIQ